MQTSLKPKDIAPHSLQVLIFDLYELKPINTKIINKRGINNKSIKIFPNKLKKKFIPKNGINKSIIRKQARKYLLA
tara:strand:+ start:185 stop:412 length:228 start_codon:yes stop_codon:yes gene_type:complete